MITSWIATILAMRIISMTAMLAMIATSMPSHPMGPKRVSITVLVHVEASFHGRAVLDPVCA